MPDRTRNFEFSVCSRPYSIPSASEPHGYLVQDGWDDFGFKTLFQLIVFDEANKKHEVGYVKIGEFDMGDKLFRTEIPHSFTRLSEEYFSLGQDDSYYVALNELPRWVKNAVLTGLRDVVADADRWERAKEEQVTRTSLLRFVSFRSVEKQYRRLVQSGERLAAYDFLYAAPKRMTDSGERLTLSFTVKPESYPPTNLHVLVGRNGVGKTHILQLMVKALAAKRSVANQSGTFSSPEAAENEDTTIFANLVFVSFSAFDDFELLPERGGAKEGIGYSYIGLRRVDQARGFSGAPKSPRILVREFVGSAQLCKRGMPAKRWKRALAVLESDPIFRAAEVAALTEMVEDKEDFDHVAENLFKRLSSGHKIVLLTITRLVVAVEEQTLVLLDEPEGHLHPPLLSAFIRALSDLMIDRNGIAIVATHSPVVLQEVPRTCAWVMQRTGKHVKAERPELETFGENVGILTREVFGYEVTESGFHKMLYDVAKEEVDFAEAVERFNGELGAEARAILRGLLAKNDRLNEG